tara:strand:+ start:2497 stop:3072 length:576 start_codon:yes stop_codon:yes gene_type:complete
MSYLKNLAFLSIILIALNSCGGKMPGADAKKFPPEPGKRVKKNLEEGRGFRLDTIGKEKGGTFDFASSNELWRASLDTIDFMPLTSANYSGGIIITDWYSNGSSNEAIKVTIRFLSNEVRSDSLAIKIYYRKCDTNFNCSVSERKGNLNKELMRKILKLAAVYEKQKKDKNFKPYIMTEPKNNSPTPKASN